MPKFDFRSLQQSKEKEPPLREQSIFYEIKEFFRSNNKKWYASDYIRSHFKLKATETENILKTLFEDFDLMRKETLKDTKILTLFKWYNEEPHDKPLSAEARKTLQKRKEEKSKIKMDRSPISSPSEIEIDPSEEIPIKDLIQEINLLKKEIETLKEELPKKDLFKSQSIMVKRACITVLKQYQNNLRSPLAEDMIELLRSIGYNPEEIIKEIKKRKRK